jgi:beta-lactamase superfamily II metal-dependent hydrolase
MSAASYGVPATDTLDVYVIDACGGKAMIVATPEGETMLIDAGHPRQDNRDTKRVIETAKSLGISRFDYIVATHYDSDHSGNVASVDAIIPGRTFVDHGKPLAELANRSNRDYDSYINAIGARKRISVKPGDTIPVKGLRITVVTSGGKAITRPLTQTAMPNEFAETTKPMSQLDHNIGSIGLLYEFGKFRMLDLADLLVSVEYKLLCPNNLLGNVDLFMVGHHGFKLSNSKFLIHAIAPKVSVMNNGPRKGGEAEVFELLKSSPGMQDIWQLHYAFNAGEQMNSPEQFIANLEQEQLCQGKLIKISAKKDGSFAIINTRNNFSKTY